MEYSASDNDICGITLHYAQFRRFKEVAGETEPQHIRSVAYDVVLNELSLVVVSGYTTDIQQQVFMVGASDEEIEEKFGFLLQALLMEHLPMVVLRWVSID